MLQGKRLRQTINGLQNMITIGNFFSKGKSHNLFLLSLLCLYLLAPAAYSQNTLNVTNFGAKGDAVQISVTTTLGSTLVTTTNVFSSLDIGKTIEIFAAGTQTSGTDSTGATTTNNQDLVATIIQVKGGTNVYLSTPCQSTAKATATIGTDNTPAFSNAISSCDGFTNSTIYIPKGNYLLMPRFHAFDAYAYGSIIIRRGGLHFIGENQTNTCLLSRGAWFIKQSNDGTPWDGEGFRGFLFEIVAPITNDYPFSLENLTLDGGVANGNTWGHGFPINLVDGGGWDEQHGAYLTVALNGQGPTLTHQIMTNVTVTHWRGEMLKTIEQLTNGNIAIYNCNFIDGNATALNIYPTIDCRYSTFSNLFQVAEIYQQYYKSAAYFMFNFATNITGNGWAWNGGVPDAPPFLMESNTFYFSAGYGVNDFQFCPAANISVINNLIYCANYQTIFAIGTAGSQGSFCNTNIVISGNVVHNINGPHSAGTLTSFASFGGPGNTAVSGLTICSNTCDGYVQKILTQGPYSTNVHFYSNVFDIALFNISQGNPMVLIETNNFYVAPNISLSSPTTMISYGSGPRYSTTWNAPGASVVLNDSESNQIPNGAYMIFDNRSNILPSSFYNIFPSQFSTNSIQVKTGQLVTFLWKNNAWSKMLPPPSSLQISP